MKISNQTLYCGSTKRGGVTSRMGEEGNLGGLDVKRY